LPPTPAAFAGGASPAPSRTSASLWRAGEMRGDYRATWRQAIERVICATPGPKAARAHRSSRWPPRPSACR
jgi:hypothetical protein